MSAVDRVIAMYREVDRISRLAPRIPYAYGGGHDALFEPSVGANGVVGYDCSGFVSHNLHHVGLLGIPHVPFPLDTNALEIWGRPGEGQTHTLWVRDWNGPLEQHHCFHEFHILNMHLFPMRWAQAAHPGTNVGWWSTVLTSGFNPRHWPGT